MKWGKRLEQKDVDEYMQKFNRDIKPYHPETMKPEKVKLKHKFKAERTERNGFNFDSKKEALRYDQLILLQQAGDIIFFLRQTPFHLPGNVTYRVDFQIFWSSGEVTFEDVKGMKTPEYIMKKKLVESLYPVKIIES